MMNSLTWIYMDESFRCFWGLSLREITTLLSVDPEKGLNDKEVKKRQKIYENDRLEGKKQSAGLKLFLFQFNSPLIYLLIFAAGLSLVLYEKIDATIILGIVFISSFLGYLQERGAAKSMESLLKKSKSYYSSFSKPNGSTGSYRSGGSR